MAVIVMTMGVMRMGVMRGGLPAGLAEESQEERAEHVKGGHASGEHAHPIHPRRVFICRGQDRILTVVARKRRHAGNGDACTEQSPEGDGSVLPQTAHL